MHAVRADQGRDCLMSQKPTAAAKIASGLQDAIEGRVTAHQPISPVALVRRKLADGRTISDPDVRGLLAEIERLRERLAPAEALCRIVLGEAWEKADKWRSLVGEAVPDGR